MRPTADGVAPFDPPRRRPGPEAAPAGGDRIAAFLLSPSGCVVWLALLTLLRLVAAGTAGLAEDEAYYRLWALAPALGYYDHPPMVAWWIAGGIALVGDDALGIRAPMVLGTLVASLLVWRIAFLIGRDLATAGRATLWFNATLLVGVGGLFATPDVPALTFWVAALWALAEFRTSEDGRWWLAVGAFAGLGLLSKYSGLFLGAGIVLWLALVPALRRAFLSPWLWAGGLVAAGLAGLNVAWNAANDWVAFAKQFGRAAPIAFRPELVAEFVGGQLLLVGPLMVPFLALGIARIVRLPPSRASLAWLLLASSAPFLAYLLVHGLHARVQGNWPMPLYGAVAVIAAVAAADLPVGRAGRVLGALRPWVAPVGIACAALAFLHLVTDAGFLSARDASKRLRGFDALAAAAERARAADGAAWIGTVHYGTTGEIAFWLRDSAVPIVPLHERERYANLPAADLASLGPGLVIVLERRAHWVDLPALFERVTEAGTLERAANGIPIARYRLFRVEGARVPLVVHPIRPGAEAGGREPGAVPTGAGGAAPA